MAELKKLKTCSNERPVLGCELESGGVSILCVTVKLVHVLCFYSNKDPVLGCELESAG